MGPNPDHKTSRSCPVAVQEDFLLETCTFLSSFVEFASSTVSHMLAFQKSIFHLLLIHWAILARFVMLLSRARVVGRDEYGLGGA